MEVPLKEGFDNMLLHASYESAFTWGAIVGAIFCVIGVLIYGVQTIYNTIKDLTKKKSHTNSQSQSRKNNSRKN